MRLIWTEADPLGRAGTEVKVGDRAKTFRGEPCGVTFFRPPHKPSSSGKVSVTMLCADEYDAEFYVGVIGAEWIEREDR